MKRLLFAALMMISGPLWAQGTRPPVYDFLGLLDTPDSYSGQAGKIVIVNPAANGLIFGSAGAGSGTVTSISALSPLFTTPDPITATGILSFTAPGLSGNVLTSNGTTWVSLPLPSFEVPITFSMSLARVTNNVTLVNDSASPGLSKYYGTDGTGAKGFYNLPAAGGVTSFSSGDLSPLFTTTEPNTAGAVAQSFGLTNAAATTVFGRAAGTSGAPTYSSSPQFTAIGNLTTNGFVKTSSFNGTLSVDTNSYLTANQTITLTGDTTGSGATSIVTSIPNNIVKYAQMQDVSATNRFLGRITAGAGDTEELTGTQATTLLDTFTSTLKGVVPSSGGGTTNFLRADGSWNVPAGGGNVSNSGTPTLDQTAVWTDATHVKGVTTIKGGTANQVLKKIDGTDYNYSWQADATGGGGGTVTSITASAPIIVTPTPLIATGVISLDGTKQTNWDNAATAMTNSTFLTTTADGILGSEVVVGATPGGELGGTWAAPTIDDSLSVASWTLVTPTIAAISNLTTNGFVKTGGAIGTLSIDTNTYLTTASASSTYQPLDTDLTSLAGITGAQGDILYYGAGGWAKLAGGTDGFQLTTHSTTADPTWTAAGGAVTLGGAPMVYLQSVPIAPTGTNSVHPTAVMMGLNQTITPVGSGKLLVTISGFIGNDTAGGGVTAQMRYGALPSGTPPPNGTATTGTAFGNQAWRTGNNMPLGLNIPFSLTGIITGLTPGIPVWIDLQLAAGVTGLAAVNCSVSAWEMPSGTVDDTAYGVGWNGATDKGPTQNAVYDHEHISDTDDDGKINVLDSVAGLIKTDASGVVSNAVAGTDYQAAGAYLTANQPISLTGDVTGGPAATSIATTIGNNKVTLGMMATMATDSILGRKTAAVGNVEVLTALPWADTGDVTRAADGTATVLASGNAGNLNSGTLLAARMPALTGDITTTAGAVATTYNNAVPTAKGGVPSGGAIGEILAKGSATSYDVAWFPNPISDVAYAGTWDGVISTAPSKNAVYDKIQTLQPLDTDLTALAGISGVRGDVLFYGASGWARLGVGTSGQQLTTNGAGADPSWAAAGSGGGGTPAGPSTAVQFEDAGAFGGDAGLTYAKATDVLTLASTGLLAFSTDTAIGRIAAGTAEINNGTLGVLRDLKLAGAIIDNNNGITKLAALLIDDTSSDAIAHIRLRDRAAPRYRSDVNILPSGGGLTFNSYDDTGGVYLPVIFDGNPIKFRFNAADTLTISSTGADLASGKIITGSGTVPTAGTTGQVLKKTSNTNYDYAWAADAGGAGGTPSGPSTAVQFEDAGAFGGDAGLLYNKTTDSLTAAGKITASSGTPWNVPALEAGAGLNTGMAAAGSLGIWLASGNSEIIISGSAHDVRFRSDGIVGFAPTTDNYNNAPDTAFARNAAGVAEVNNGTAAQYRDLKLRTLLASDGSYPGTPSISFAGWPTNGLLPWPGVGAPIMISGGSPIMAWVSGDSRIAGPLSWGGSGVTGSSDVGLDRSAAGTLKVTNGSTGTGNLTVNNLTVSGTCTGCGGGGATPGGSDTYVQFNDGGTTFGGDAGMVYNKTTDTITVRSKPRITTISSSYATPTINTDATDAVTITGLNTAITNMSTNTSGTPNNFDSLKFRIKDSGTAQNITWGTKFASSQSTLPTTTTAGKTMTVGFLYDSVAAEWECIAVDVEDAALATFQGTLQNPTNTTSTTGVMLGLGSASWGTAQITPAVTGKIVVAISGTLFNNTAAASTFVQIRYGLVSGGVPNNGAALTGTAVGGLASRGGAGGAASVSAPFGLTSVITGLTVGAPIWIDVSQTVLVASTGTVQNVAVTAYEIP